MDPLVDLATARQVANDCGWTLQKLGRFYVDGVRKQMVKMREAVAAGDEEELFRLAHGSAGSSGLSGVPGIGDRFREIENADDGASLEVAPGVLADIDGLLEEVSQIFEGSALGAADEIAG